MGFFHGLAQRSHVSACQADHVFEIIALRLGVEGKCHFVGVAGFGIVFVGSDILDRRNVAAAVFEQDHEKMVVSLVTIAGHFEAIVAVAVKQAVSQMIAGTYKLEMPVVGTLEVVLDPVFDALRGELGRHDVVAEDREDLEKFVKTEILVSGLPGRHLGRRSAVILGFDRCVGFRAVFAACRRQRANRQKKYYFFHGRIMFCQCS